jgi:hypothetical protein
MNYSTKKRESEGSKNRDKKIIVTKLKMLKKRGGLRKNKINKNKN